MNCSARVISEKFYKVSLSLIIMKKSLIYLLVFLFLAMPFISSSGIECKNLIESDESSGIVGIGHTLSSNNFYYLLTEKIVEEKSSSVVYVIDLHDYSIKQEHFLRTCNWMGSDCSIEGTLIGINEKGFFMFDGYSINFYYYESSNPFPFSSKEILRELREKNKDVSFFLNRGFNFYGVESMPSLFKVEEDHFIGTHSSRFVMYNPVEEGLYSYIGDVEERIEKQNYAKVIDRNTEQKDSSETITIDVPTSSCIKLTSTLSTDGKKIIINCDRNNFYLLDLNKNSVEKLELSLPQNEYYLIEGLVENLLIISYFSEEEIHIQEDNKVKLERASLNYKNFIIYDLNENIIKDRVKTIDGIYIGEGKVVSAENFLSRFVGGIIPLKLLFTISKPNYYLYDFFTEEKVKIDFELMPGNLKSRFPIATGDSSFIGLEKSKFIKSFYRESIIVGGKEKVDISLGNVLFCKIV